MWSRGLRKAARVCNSFCDRQESISWRGVLGSVSILLGFFRSSSANAQDSDFLFGLLSLRQWLPRVRARIKGITVTWGTVQNHSYSLPHGYSVPVTASRGMSDVQCNLWSTGLRNPTLASGPQASRSHLLLSCTDHSWAHWVSGQACQPKPDTQCPLCLPIHLRSSNLEERKKYRDGAVISPHMALREGHISWWMLTAWPSLP